ncbi:DUF6886 family protein [Micromonospora orduensis]|uniref:DUF6886 family protein n=1 Tax=Micromonospora orduensis TaxID=1420891 RepID=UPI0031381A09
MSWTASAGPKSVLPAYGCQNAVELCTPSQLGTTRCDRSLGRWDRDRVIGAGCGERVHAIEYGWLEAMRGARLFAYRLPADRFPTLRRSRTARARGGRARHTPRPCRAGG